jgi:hypothetical protein
LPPGPAHALARLSGNAPQWPPPQFAWSRPPSPRARRQAARRGRRKTVRPCAVSRSLVASLSPPAAVPGAVAARAPAGLPPSRPGAAAGRPTRAAGIGQSIHNGVQAGRIHTESLAAFPHGDPGGRRRAAAPARHAGPVVRAPFARATARPSRRARRSRAPTSSSHRSPWPASRPCSRRARSGSRKTAAASSREARAHSGGHHREDYCLGPVIV